MCGNLERALPSPLPGMWGRCAFGSDDRSAARIDAASANATAEDFEHAWKVAESDSSANEGATEAGSGRLSRVFRRFRHDPYSRAALGYVSGTGTINGYRK